MADPVPKTDRLDFQIFIPDDWRVLRPCERIEYGDYAWKKDGMRTGHYVLTIEVGDLVGHQITCIRRI